MNLAELGKVLDASSRVLRLETRDEYASNSDVDWPAAYLRGDPPPDIEQKRPWLNRLAAAAEAGHPRQQLRVVRRPVGTYVRYSCEWGYTDNVRAGQLVRILDEANWAEGVRSAEWAGELVLADERVIAMRYDSAGRFQDAEDTDDQERARTVETLWAFATEFSNWWNANQDLHRVVHV